MAVDYEYLLLTQYTDGEAMRKLIDLGLKDEVVEILGEDALAVWKESKDWYQHKTKPIPESILMEMFEQYVVKTRASDEDDIDPDPKWLVERLQERHHRQRYKARLAKATTDGTFDTGLTLAESLQATKGLARDLLKIAVSSTSEKPLQPMSVGLPVFIEETLTRQQRIEEGDEKKPVTFGFGLVDKAYQGIRPGELVVMAAFTGAGKSFLMCKCALAAAKAGYKVALWTLENSEDETFARLTALAGGLSYAHVSQALLHPNHAKMFRELVGDEVFDLIYVKEPKSGEGSSLDEIYWQSFDVGVDLIIGDQLSHVHHPQESKGESDYLTEEKKLRHAKDLTKETGVAAIWAAQLNVKAHGKADIDMTMMARSQGYNREADFVFGLSDPSNGTGNNRRLECIKTRRGPNVAWELLFNFDPMDIKDVLTL